MTAHQLTKLFLRLFILSIIVTAVIGIITISIPVKQGWYEIKILLTTLTIAAASICGLACGGCLSRGHMILPVSGLVLTGVTAVLFLIGLWSEIESEAFWKTSFVLLFYAVACAHLSMLYMANLAGGYRWSYLVAYQLVLGLATLLTAGIVFEFFKSEAYGRLVGVISILVAAVTLMIPVFHFFSRDKFAALQQAADPILAIDNEVARLKNRITQLEAKRQMLLNHADQASPPAGESAET
jgi:hypothetical protein